MATDTDQCGFCSKVYENTAEYIKHDPLCNGVGLVIDEDEQGNKRALMYIPCKDSYYDNWLEINYCPMCGKKIEAK